MWLIGLQGVSLFTHSTLHRDTGVSSCSHTDINRWFSYKRRRWRRENHAFLTWLFCPPLLVAAFGWDCRIRVLFLPGSQIKSYQSGGMLASTRNVTLMSQCPIAEKAVIGRSMSWPSESPCQNLCSFCESCSSAVAVGLRMRAFLGNRDVKRLRCLTYLLWIQCSPM